MKAKTGKLSLDVKKKTVTTSRGFKAIHLSIEIKCEKDKFESYIRRSAKLLESYDLENVKTLSIDFELLD